MIGPMADALRNFFDLNAALVFFVYGQVFFVLGLAIALQSRRHSRLALARSLGWLSAFGIVHGLHEWGSFFIPLQSSYMSTTMLTLMQVIQAVFLGISFTFLFQFGVDLLTDRWPWMLRAPLLVTAVWFALSIYMLIAEDLPMGIWLVRTSIWARYLIGFPAALVAAYGLRYQAEHQIKPLGLSRIYRTLGVAGFTMVAYAILAGLIVPAGHFFPADVLNDSLTFRYLGIPVYVFRSVAGLIIAVAIIRALEVFDLETDRLIEQMEIEQSLAAERERIGRELHDGAIQQAYTAGLIIESTRSKVEEGGVLAHRLDRAMLALNQAIASLRAYMSDLRPGPADIPLIEGLQQQAADPRYSALMDVNLQVDLPASTTMDPVQTTHVLAIVGEALSNAARHGQARHVWLRASRQNGQFVLQIRDDGQGFNEHGKPDGYGLRNMRDRARLLGGKLTIESQPARGTSVTLLIPWEEI